MERIKKGNQGIPTSGKPSRGYRPPSGNLLHEIYATGSRRLYKMSNTEIFFLSLWGGAFMTIAALISVMLSLEIVISGVQFILISLGLTIGLLLVILTNSILFTEANVYVPSNLYNITLGQAFGRLFRFWVLSWFGNIFGAIIMGFLIYLSQDYSQLFTNTITAILVPKMEHLRLHRYHGPGELVVSGMIANWIIALVTLFALSSRNLINQFIIIFLAFLVIVSGNFQYFPANLGYFTNNLFRGGSSMGILDIFFLNLIPVSIGNILGSTILVAWPLLFLSKKRFS